MDADKYSRAMKMHAQNDEPLARAVRTLLSVASALPKFASLAVEREEAAQAQDRGFFLPDEDARLRAHFASYLRLRAALWETLNEVRPLLSRSTEQQQLRLFAVGYCCTCMLVRSARFLVDQYHDQPVVWKKLDEAEPVWGIPAKKFSEIYRSLTQPKNVFRFLMAVHFYQDHEEEFESLAADPLLAPVLPLLRAEQISMDANLKYFSGLRLNYRQHLIRDKARSGIKRVTFALFQVSGSFIAELRNQWRRKRVTPGVQRKIGAMLEPGDVIITRHDDAASNFFLPGFWPHGALYIGTESQRRELGLEVDAERVARSRDPHAVLEARKDGVLFRPLSDTLGVDCVTVIRPRLRQEEIREALSRALPHEGKGYDFEFDFRRSDKLVCTEVAYRAYHGIGNIALELTQRGGRYCLSAEDLLDRAVDRSCFDVLLVYGVRGNRFVSGPKALETLVESY
jgi:hypothetical protein